jgi:hypothetical protein
MVAKNNVNNQDGGTRTLGSLLVRRGGSKGSYKSRHGSGVLKHVIQDIHRRRHPLDHQSRVPEQVAGIREIPIDDDGELQRASQSDR